MPFDLEWEMRGLVIRYSGSLMPSDVVACHERVAAAPRFDDLRFAIVDARSVQALTATGAEIEPIEAFLRGPAMTNAAISVVFVATEPSVLAALGTYNAICDRDTGSLSAIRSARRGRSCPPGVRNRVHRRSSTRCT